MGSYYAAVLLAVLVHKRRCFEAGVVMRIASLHNDGRMSLFHELGNVLTPRSYMLGLPRSLEMTLAISFFMTFVRQRFSAL